jgi:archaellum component FlaC
MALTRITSTVLDANAVSAEKLANSSIVTRHLGDAVVTLRNLAADANTASVSAGLTTNVNAVQTNVNSVQTNVNSVQTNVTALTTSTNTIQANVDAVQSNVFSVFTSTNTILANVNAVQSNVTTLTTNVNSVQSNVNTVQGNVTSLTTSVNTIRANVNSVQSNVGTLTTSVNTIQANVNSVQSNVGTLTTSVNTIKANVDSVQSNVATAVTNINTVQSNVTSLTTSVNTIAANVNSVQSNVNTVQSNVTSLTTSTNTIRANVNSVQSNVDTNYLQAQSNDFATYTRLYANINSVQTNVSAITNGATVFTTSKTFNQNVTILGNLIVVGAQVDLSVGSATISDAIVTLAANLAQNIPPPADSGILLNRGNQTNVFIGIDLSDNHLAVSFTDSPGDNVTIAPLGFVDIRANAYHAESGSVTHAAFSKWADVSTGIYFPAASTIGIVTGGVEQVRIGGAGNVSITSGVIEGPRNVLDLDDDELADRANSITLRSTQSVGIFLDTLNTTVGNFLGVYNNSADPNAVTIDDAIFSVRDSGEIFTKEGLNLKGNANVVINVVAGNAVIAPSIFEAGVGLRANDYATYTILYANINSVQSNVTSLTTSVNTIRANVNSVQSNVGTLTTSVNTIAANVNSVQSNVGTLTTSVNTIKANVDSVQSNVATAVTNINTVQSNVTSLTTSVNTIAANVNSVQANVNTVQSNVTSLTTSTNTIRANVNSVQSNVDTNYLQAQSNDFITYTRITANVNAVQGNLTSSMNQMVANVNTVQNNVTALTGGALLLVPFTNTNVSTSSSNVYFVGKNVANYSNIISVTVDGIYQAPIINWIGNFANDTVQFTDAALPAGLTITISSLT